MSTQLALPEILPPLPKKFPAAPRKAVAYTEVATIRKGEFLEGMFNTDFPNRSAIIRYRSEGQGIGIYDTMLRTDPELTGFFAAIADDALHYPFIVRAASDAPEHKEHARFCEFVLSQIPHHQNVLRRIMDSRAYGFSVLEKIYKVVDRGEWRGAVVLADVIDKPHRWFTFDMDRNLRFKTAQNQSPGDPLDQEKFIIVTFGSNNSPWGEPILDDCYFPYRLKHHFLEMHALWMEKWAAPTPKIGFDWSKDTKISEANRAEALRVAMSIQRDQAVAFPKGMDVSLLESLRSGSISYENAIGMCTDMEALLVTGQKLAIMAGSTGSYAQSQTHQKQLSNKVEMMAAFSSSQFSRQVFVDLVSRNYGPQDMYPIGSLLARDPLELQEQSKLETMQMANGHQLSASHSRRRSMIVMPSGPDDVLKPATPPTTSQTLPISPALAADDKPKPQRIDLAGSPVYHEARIEADRKLAHVKSKAERAQAHARPAMTKIVKSLGAAIKEKKSVKRVTKAHLFKKLKGVSGAHQLGQAFETMLNG